MSHALGRHEPSDWVHVERYPLSSAQAETIQVPGIAGINWYSNFDRPEKVGRYHWIGRGDLGQVRGGHAICLLPEDWRDYLGWWDFYDQGAEGACVGFAWSRAMSLLNRRRYDARWLYRQAQLVDEWPGEDYDGTSVRAGGNVLLSGHRRTWGGQTRDLDPEAGIQTYRWAADWDGVRRSLGIPDDEDGVALLNSWGRDYPHITKITDEAGERVLAEHGEVAFPTDR